MFIRKLLLIIIVAPWPLERAEHYWWITREKTVTVT